MVSIYFPLCFLNVLFILKLTTILCWYFVVIHGSFAITIFMWIIQEFVCEKGVGFVRIDGNTLASDRQNAVLSFQSSNKACTCSFAVALCICFATIWHSTYSFARDLGFQFLLGSFALIKLHFIQSLKFVLWCSPGLFWNWLLWTILGMLELY